MIVRVIIVLMALVQSQPASAAETRLNVVATFSVIADFARNVGGDAIALTTLVGPDGDAHVYEPKPADVVAMTRADVVLVNGLHFEGFLDRLVETSGTEAAVVELTKGVAAITSKSEHAHSRHDDHRDAASGEASETDEDLVDPHAFQSVANARIYVKNILAAFCAADADQCDTFTANAGAYLQKLDTLDLDIKSVIAAIPSEGRTIITSHDAFGYFEQAYGLSILAPEGISTEAEPTAADVAALIRQVKANHASAIFIENIANARLVGQIAQETGLTLGGTLYSDALSPSDGPAATYVDMMRHNITTIERAISGR